MAFARLITLAALVCAGAAFGQEETAPPVPPKRVVSMNLCTDQLAMMLAHDGQLISVSHLAQDPRSSAMPDEARHYEINHGRAEEIYLLRPDLVITGAYSNRATADMLRRLDVPVAVIDPAQTLEDVSLRLREIGVLLGREEAAEARIAAYETDLAALRHPAETGPRAAFYAANGWTSGDASLAGQILHGAGLRNIATEMGFEYGTMLPLEMLAMAAPDMVLTPTPYAGSSRAEDMLLHPIVDTYRQGHARAHIRDSDWACGTPHVLRAIKGVIDARQRFETEGK